MSRVFDDAYQHARKKGVPHDTARKLAKAVERAHRKTKRQYWQTPKEN